LIGGCDGAKFACGGKEGETTLDLKVKSFDGVFDRGNRNHVVDGCCGGGAENTADPAYRVTLGDLEGTRLSLRNVYCGESDEHVGAAPN